LSDSERVEINFEPTNSVLTTYVLWRTQ